MWNPIGPIEHPRAIWVGCFGSSGISGFVLGFVLETWGRGQELFILIVVASPVVFVCMHLVFILPCYFALLSCRRLSFIALYLSSTVVVFLVWLVSAGRLATVKNILDSSMVISATVLVLVSLFWLLSYPGVQPIGGAKKLFGRPR
jgi:hypothetical protein